MTRDERASHGQQYTVGTGNIITGGTVTNSPMTNVGGRQNRVDVTNALSAGLQQSWFPQLRDELARIRPLLEGDHGSAVSEDDRDDAIDAVRALQTEVADAQDSGEADPKGFRRRVKELIGVLAPVAEIVGGVAALQAILQHL
jgi:hypothetical protein